MQRWSSCIDTRNPSRGTRIARLPALAFRLIVTVDYPTKRLFVKALLTHKEYDRKEWMKWR